MFSREAFKLCVLAFPEILTKPSDLDARGRMLLGAALAGLAIENSMLGAAHAAANPLTAHCGIVHGQAVGLMLPAVIRYNAEEHAARSIYAELAATLETVGAHRHEQPGNMLAQRVEALLNIAQLPRSLSACGVEHSLLPTLAAEAARQWTAGFNPRPVTEASFLALYEQSF